MSRTRRCLFSSVPSTSSSCPSHPENHRNQKQRNRERALAAVKISASDVDVLAREFDLPKAAAERALREAGGDAKAALTKLCCSTGA